MIDSITYFDAVTFTKSQTRNSDAILLRALNPDAKLFFESSFSTDSTSTVTITYEVCDTEEGTYFNPNVDTSNQIVASTDFNKKISPVPGTPANLRLHKWMKIKVVEDGLGPIPSFTGRLIVVNRN